MEEENKEGEFLFVAGTHEQFKQDVKNRLEDVDLNPLEQGLMERYMDNTTNLNTNMG